MKSLKKTYKRLFGENSGAELDNIRDAYYEFGDAVEGLGELANKKLKSDGKLKSIINKIYKLDDELTRYLDQAYKGWD